MDQDADESAVISSEKRDSDMADELDALRLSTEAKLLIVNLACGCTVHKKSGGAPGIVFLPPLGPIPRSPGQAADSVIDELLDCDLVHLFGETFPAPCKLTPMGEAYYDRFLKNGATHI